MKECVARISQSYVHWLWKQLHAVSQSLTGKWLQIKLTIMKSSVLSVTTAGLSALLTSIILPIPSGVHKCHVGSSHLAPAVASNTHVWSSLGHSPLPIKWHYFRKVSEFTLPVSMVNTVVQQLLCSYFFGEEKRFRENVLKRVYLTFSSGLLSSACAGTQLSGVVLSVSAHLHQQLLASGPPALA